MSKTFSEHKFSNYTQTIFHKLERYFWATCLVFIVSYGDGNDSLIKISIEQDKRAFCATFCAILCSSIQIIPTEACNFRSVGTRSFATILGFLVTVLSGICLSFFLWSVYGIWFPVIQLAIYFGIHSLLGILSSGLRKIQPKVEALGHGNEIDDMIHFVFDSTFLLVPRKVQHSVVIC